MNQKHPKSLVQRLSGFIQKQSDLVPKLSYRLATFGFLLNIFVIFLFVLGNFQNFVDSTLVFLLRLSTFGAYFTVFFCLVAMITRTAHRLSLRRIGLSWSLGWILVMMLVSLIDLLVAKFALNLF